MQQELNSIINDDYSDMNLCETVSREASPYISVDEMAKILSIARITAYQLTKTVGFPCFKIGKRIIIPRCSLHKWAEEQAREQNALFQK